MRAAQDQQADRRQRSQPADRTDRRSGWRCSPSARGSRRAGRSPSPSRCRRTAFQNTNERQRMSRGAGQPRGPHPQPQQEAPEEHRLGPVALEERLARSPAPAGAGAESARGAPAASGRPCGRSDSRCCRRRSPPAAARAITELDLQLARCWPGSAADDQRGLARHRGAARLGHHQQDQHRVADVVGDVDQRGKRSSAPAYGEMASGRDALDAGSWLRASRMPRWLS